MQVRATDENEFLALRLVKFPNRMISQIMNQFVAVIDDTDEFFLGTIEVLWTASTQQWAINETMNCSVSRQKIFKFGMPDKDSKASIKIADSKGSFSCKLSRNFKLL